MNPGRLPVVVLASGRGSNLQAILDAARDPDFSAEVRAVIANEPGARALERAAAAGVPARLVEHRGHPDRASFERVLAEAVDAYEPGLVVLAGFMRVLTPAFVERYAGRLMNIHPSLLPRFPGLDTHRRAIEAGDAEHGVTVHFVTAALDGGPIVAQARVPILPGDDADTLAARVLEQEHRIYPFAIRCFAEGRLEVRGDVVYLDGAPALDRAARES